jgi:predicted TIM-barrel fold metal-dependent hydrolase
MRTDYATHVGEAGFDPHAWLREIESDGVWGGVVFPSVSMILYALPDGDLLDAIFRAYNGWISEFASAAPQRIKPVGMVNVDVPTVAATEIERLAAAGFAGALIPVVPPHALPYSSEAYEPVWAAAAAARLPLHLHVVTDRNPGQFGHTTVRAAVKVNDPDHWVRLALTDLVFNGVFDRHPDLRVVSVEHEGGWVRHWMDRMDWHYRYNLSLFEARLANGALPSDHVRANVFVSFTEDANLVADRHHIGVGNLLWGSDFPHAESSWPTSRATIDAVAAIAGREDTRRMTWSNAAALYGFS